MDFFMFGIIPVALPLLVPNARGVLLSGAYVLTLILVFGLDMVAENIIAYCFVLTLAAAAVQVVLLLFGRR
jgi:hypothetical protein